MNSPTDGRMIVGLDIGTSKVVAIVAEIGFEGEIEIVGIGSHPSRGLKKGVVVNIESTVQSIQRAVEEAELMAGCQIHSVYAGIAGNHIRSLNSHGIVAIRDREVFQPDIERVIDAAQAVAIPADQNQYSPNCGQTWQPCSLERPHMSEAKCCYRQTDRQTDRQTYSPLGK